MIDRDDLSDLHAAAIAVQEAIGALVERLEVLLPEPEPVAVPDAERFMADPPDAKTDRRINTTLRLEPELLEQLKIVAARKRMRVNDLLLEGVRHVLALYGERAA